MIRDITIGQYYQTESSIHGLDPRVKLMGTLVIYNIVVCRKKYMGLSIYYSISVNNYKNIKSTIKIYCKKD